MLLLALVLLSLLAFSKSRSGWLGTCTAMEYIVYQRLHRERRKRFLLVMLLILIAIFLATLFYKPDSSLGRKHIYSLSEKMLEQNWVSGIGNGKFKAQFNEHQADYFSSHNIDSKGALLADNTFYAFNDYLQWFIETGIAGLVGLIIFLYIIVRRATILNKAENTSPVITGAAASLICIAIASLFSYPLQTIPIQAVTLVCLGFLAFFRSGESKVGRGRRFSGIALKLLIVPLTGLFFYNTFHVVARKKMERRAFELARSGYKKEAIIKYQQIVKKYPNAGYNQFFYARQLYYSNQLLSALKILNEGREFYTDNAVYKLKGDIEQELGLFDEAEKSYLRAIYMVPNRMGSRYDLLYFYLNQKDSVKAAYWANSILNMPVKVPSERTERMLGQTKTILKGLQLSAN